MVLFEIETHMPFPVEDVFALTVNLEDAPRWHSIFSSVEQLTGDPIEKGTCWKINYTVGSFELEIVDYQPPHKVTFKGSKVTGGTIPNFTIELETIPGGTLLRYIIHPEIPSLLRPLMGVIALPYGKLDLRRYFNELDMMLISASKTRRKLYESI